MSIIGPRLEQLQGKTIASCVQADTGTLVITFTDNSILTIDVRTSVTSNGHDGYNFCGECEFTVHNMNGVGTAPQLILFGEDLS